MTMRWIGWSLMALYGIVLLLVMLWVRRQRQARMDLHWPPSMTQHQMERCGSRFLEGMGWEVIPMASQASRSILQCVKGNDELFVVFLRDGAFFSRLMVMMAKFGAGMTRRLVVVLYDPPLETMIKIAAEQVISLAHFQDLRSFTDAESARRPGLLAAREIARKVQAVQTT